MEAYVRLVLPLHYLTPLYISQPYFRSTDYNYDAAKKASGNVAGLCSWCKAMCTYHEVAKVVEPKIAALMASEAELKVSTPRAQKLAFKIPRST